MKEQLCFEFFYEMKPEIANILDELKKSLSKMKEGKEREVALEIYLKFIDPLLTLEEIRKQQLRKKKK